ncbi:hypothetical protein ACVNF4_09835 [Streptomyces sp. S6]
MDDIDYEWEELSLKQMIDDYEALDQEEYAEFMREFPEGNDA